MKQKILIVQPIPSAGLEVLDSRRYEICWSPAADEATVTRELKDAAAMIVRISRVTPQMIAAASHLKVIGRYGVGVDNIPIDAATARGVAVVNTPNTNTVSVAEHTILAFGALAKRITAMDQAVRGGDWAIRYAPGLMELDGKTLGLIGLGSIGSLVAKKARAAFNMRVLAFDPYIGPESATSLGVEPIPEADGVFRTADIISLHMPLTPETRGFVDARRLSLMKPGVLLVNFARGEVVNEADLFNALTTGVLAGAALDAFCEEPPPADHPLFRLDNVLLSPHSAALTKEASERMTLCVAEGVADVLEGRRPRNLVNQEVFSTKGQ